ncbi:hypothetical protein MP228_003427 [Amoeboaphelidium protococcarum]|nr:hypothetical protein MP228_003427 [Amoeboaphelidium protococcarum]
MRINTLIFCVFGVLPAALGTQIPFYLRNQIDVFDKALVAINDQSSLSIQSMHEAVNRSLTADEQQQFWSAVMSDSGMDQLYGNAKCRFNVPDLPTDCDVQEPDATLVQAQGVNGVNSSFRISAKDIKIIASFGDSMTAGLFMNGNKATLFRHMFKLGTEDRGLIWSTGGIGKSVTLANILSTVQGQSGSVNQDVHLYGKAYQRTPTFTSVLDLNVKEFNFAECSLPFDQLHSQVAVFKQRYRQLVMTQPQYGIKWKWLHLFGGGINLCNHCFPEEFMTDMRDMRKYLRKLVGDLHQEYQSQYFVLSFYTLFRNPSQVYDLGAGSENSLRRQWCASVQKNGDFCRCMFRDQQTRQTADEWVLKFNQMLVDTIAELQIEYQSETFRLNLIRTMESVDMKELGEGFLSGTDCFHPSLCFSRLIAYKLWEDAVSGQLHDTADPSWYAKRPIKWTKCLKQNQEYNLYL